MKFGPVATDQADGAILAHSVMLNGHRLRKGLVLGPDDIASLRAAGIAQVVAARPGPDDVPEDAAAARLAAALVPDPAAAGLVLTDPFTGRVNLNAVAPGIVLLDPAAIHALNRIDPAITLATLSPFARVSAGTLVGTVKIITYAVPRAALAQAEALAQRAIRVQPVVRRSAGLLMTDVPGQQDRLIAKGRRAVEARLRALGMTLACVVTVPHETDAMARALADLPGEMLLILTGSATSDPCDTAPQAVRAAGGTVLRFGMPVDPGNLLFHGHLGSRPVIGLPGCARSPALNGADWVLERLACGLTLTDDDIAAMGVGGLLKETPVRPQPREAQQGRPTHG
ncbi:MAG: molybdopterin-binding protein [Rhodobacter sp.]|nr:molybdopterin-binding protein [Rhodobacter sp.]MCA3494689.1 molybdopterin-binding protein [Rhodobacter sp.]MCA3501274.1 molybdopterin-binding protein [Rhodobacter sp.]MCA3505131.1 molybdopterin-binding protein [Rhodobacter sp.]MCA3518227.1 molybdopterin-binding protein [Rhodobacter sp.]